MIPVMCRRRAGARCLSSLLLLLLGAMECGTRAAAVSNRVETQALQRAEAALGTARAALWERAMVMGGDVRIRSNSDGERRLLFELELDPGTPCPRTVFTLFSTVGTALERMTVE
ncbi:MAG TPA: hypothetical protein EYP62_05840, partial [Kiritimatiellae bacterium]|nr:hypothetical protein [Kiritimatiellia bacterium]